MSSHAVPSVEIISHSHDVNKLAASAARISTRKGTASEIWNMSTDDSQDLNLIKKVVSSGHETILEHACFTLAFTNVSAYVEQFFIEHRLASFTVKSRRYVDFYDAGYYLPVDLPDEVKKPYSSHVDFLFSQYEELVTHGIPKEDARFVLPYCFSSNFFCTLNARELKHILRKMKGLSHQHKEFAILSDQLVTQLQTVFPYAIPDNPDTDNLSDLSEPRNSQSVVSPVSSNVTLAAYNDNTLPLTIHEGMYGIVKDNEKLEHIIATFTIRNISLAGITHLARHRMQSLIIPDYSRIDYSCYIFPASIKENEEMQEIYHNCFKRNLDFVTMHHNHLKGNRVYLCMSGNTTDVITTMNARELNHFFCLRCCNRAQWEIRQIANTMLAELQQKDSSVFEKMGPSCARGKCPEGKMSCGHPYNR